MALPLLRWQRFGQRGRNLAALGLMWLMTTAVYGGTQVDSADTTPVVRFDWRVGNAGGSCSGVLIAPRAVLTAGHCVRTPRDRVRRVRSVRIGNPNAETQRVRVASVVVHPNYAAARPESGHDIAVILLRDAAHASPVSIMTAAEEEGIRRIRVMGFGITRARARRTRLREASLHLLSPFQCFSGPVERMAETRMCGASPEAGVCPGDSGGPVFAQVGGVQKLIGIISLGIDNAARCTESAMVMTRASAFRDWVAQTATPPS